MKLAEHARLLLEGVLIPLLRGGDVRLLDPVGAPRAQELENGLPGSGLFDEVGHLKLRAGRRLWPVDDLGEIASDEWSLLVALNDLLQLTNPSLCSGVRSSKNSTTLAQHVERCIERAGPPLSARQALSRHALFSKVRLLIRCDTELSWWTGSGNFVGRDPPARLTSWPELRRVKQRRIEVPLARMAPRVPRYRELLERWLTSTPLTLFAGLGALGIEARWSAPMLRLVTNEPGRTLALRAVVWSDDAPTALEQLSAATRALGELGRPGEQHARLFTDLAFERFQQLSS